MWQLGLYSVQCTVYNVHCTHCTWGGGGVCSWSECDSKKDRMRVEAEVAGKWQGGREGGRVAGRSSRLD